MRAATTIHAMCATTRHTSELSATSRLDARLRTGSRGRGAADRVVRRRLRRTAQDPRLGDFVFSERVAKVGGACPLPSDTNTGGADCLRQRDFSGNLINRTPKVSGRITPGFTLLDGKLRAEVDLQYYGKRSATWPRPRSCRPTHLVNAQVRYAVTDDLSLYVYGTNLTNEIGLTEGNPRAGQLISGEGGSRIGTARPELGRAFRAAVLYRF